MLFRFFRELALELLTKLAYIYSIAFNNRTRDSREYTMNSSTSHRAPTCSGREIEYREDNWTKPQIIFITRNNIFTEEYYSPHSYFAGALVFLLKLPSPSSDQIL